MSGRREGASIPLLMRLNWLILPGLAALSALAMASLLRGLMNALGLSGIGNSIDLASYWSPARILLQGWDPYRAVLLTPELLPSPGGLEEAHPGFSPLPGAAPLQLLLMAPLAWLPWPAARAIFALANLATALALPWWLSKKVGLSTRNRLAIALALFFWALLPTRNAIANGQTTLLVLSTGLLTIEFSDGHPWLSGLLLAFSLTKYSLSLPLLIFFILLGNWLPLMVGILMNLAAVPIISLLSGSSIPAILSGYLVMTGRYLPVIGDLDLPGLLQRWGAEANIGRALSILGLVLVLGMVTFLWLRHRQGDRLHIAMSSSCRLVLASFLIVSSLPFIYHSGYDAAVFILVPYSALAMVQEAGQVQADGTSGLALFFVSLLLLSVFLLPRQSLTSVIVGWEQLLLSASSLVTFSLWLVSAVIVFRCPLSKTGGVGREI